MQTPKILAVAIAAVLGGHAAASQTITGGVLHPDRPALAQKVSSTDTERLLRSIISELQEGKPDYSRMEPPIQMFIQQQRVLSSELLQGLGTLQKVEFLKNQDGTDFFRVDFLHGPTTWTIRLSNSGKVAELTLQPYHAANK